MPQGSSNTGALLGWKECYHQEGSSVKGSGVQQAETKEQEEIHVCEDPNAHECQKKSGGDADAKVPNEPTEEVGAVLEAHHLHTFT
jgi:hypothetical protein